MSLQLGETCTPTRLVDANLKGLGLEGPRRLRVDDIVRISAPEFLATASSDPPLSICAVRWCHRVGWGNYRLGVMIVGTSHNARQTWIRELLKGQGIGDNALYMRRELLRIDCRRSIRLDLDGGRSLSGRILDLSIGGTFFESAHEVHRGEVGTAYLGWGGRVGFRVLSVHPFEEGYRASLRFEKVGPKEREQIEKLLVRLIRRRR